MGSGYILSPDTDQIQSCQCGISLEKRTALVYLFVSVAPSEVFSSWKYLFLFFVFRAEAGHVPIHHHHHHHHAWTFLDFLWRCSPEPDRQRRGSPAKSLHCRNGFFLLSLLTGSFFIAYDCGSIPEKLWLKSNMSAIVRTLPSTKSIHPDRPFRGGPPPF